MHTKNMNPSISFCIDLVHCTLAKCSVLCLTGFFVCVWFTLLWQVNALVFSCTYILVMASCPSLLFALLFTSLTGFHQNIFVVYPCSSEELQYGHAILSSILSKCDITHFPLVMTSSVRYVPHLKMSKKKRLFSKMTKKRLFSKMTSLVMMSSGWHSCFLSVVWVVDFPYDVWLVLLIEVSSWSGR